MMQTRLTSTRQYVLPRRLEEIDAELKDVEAEIAGLLKEVAG